MNRRQLLQTLPALAAAGVPASAAKTTARIRTGIVAYSFRKQFEAKRMDYEKLIALVSDLGLDGLDTTVYWFPDTSDAYLAKLRAAAYKNAVSLYSIAARIHLCQPTPELRQAQVANIHKWVDVAQKLGAAHIRVFGGDVPKGVSESQAVSWAAEVLKRGADFAGARGIFLGVEDDGGLSTNAEPTVEIVRQAAHPFAGVNIDVGNFPKNGYQQVEYCLPYAVNCHFKVNVSSPDGKKEAADWDRLVGLFAKAGYKGYLSLEYEESGAAETDVPRYATRLRDTVRKVAG